MKRLLSFLFLLSAPALPGVFGCAFCESVAAPELAADMAKPAPSSVSGGSNAAASPSAPRHPDRAPLFRRIPSTHAFTFM